MNVPLIGFLFCLRKKGPALSPGGLSVCFPVSPSKKRKKSVRVYPARISIYEIDKGIFIPVRKIEKITEDADILKALSLSLDKKYLLNFLNPFYGARRTRFQEIQFAPHAEHRHAALFPLCQIVFIACNNAALFSPPGSFERRLFDGRKYLRRVIVRQTTEVAG